MDSGGKNVEVQKEINWALNRYLELSFEGISLKYHKQYGTQTPPQAKLTHNTLEHSQTLLSENMSILHHHFNLQKSKFTALEITLAPEQEMVALSSC